MSCGGWESTGVDRQPDAEPNRNDDPAKDAADAAGHAERRNPARTIFDPAPDLEQDAIRAARRRAAIWGLATGGVMALIVALCLLLLYLVSTSGS